MPMRVELRLLGTPQLLVDGGPAPVDLEWRKHKALLIYLACSTRPRSREHLAELLWPTGNAPRSLAQALVAIRKVLGAGLEGRGTSVQLQPDAVQLDLVEATALAESRDWARASVLVRGGFCEDFEVRDAPDFDHWLTSQRLQWRGLCLDIVTRNAERLLDRGEALLADTEFRRARELDPNYERAVRGLMRALTLSDQRVAALEEFRLLVARLAELGSQPTDDSTRLAERIRQWRGERQVEAVDAPVSRRRAPLVGRQEPLSRIRALWSLLQQERRPAVVFIEGESGGGKTRLLEELTIRARLDGAAISLIRLLPADQGREHGVVLGLAQGGLLHARAVSAAPPEALAALAARAPEWASRYPHLTGSVLPLGEALGHVFRTVGEEQPLLLLVDDAQWHDPESIDALEAILRDHPNTPLLLGFALEPGGNGQRMEQLRARIGRDVDGLVVPLLRLGATEILELASWTFPLLDPGQLERVTRRILADSAGIPLLVTELLSAAAEGLDLGSTDGTWPRPEHTLTDTAPGEIPNSVVGAFRLGFRQLSRPAQEVLRTLAVCGTRLTEQALQQVTDVPAADVSAALDELEWQRWVNVEARGYDLVARIARLVTERDMTTPGQRERILARWRGLPPGA